MEVLPDFSALAPALDPTKFKEMLTVTHTGGKTHVRINSSSLGIILGCPRKSYYELHRGLKSKAEAPALTFGTAIHKALEIFYSHPTSERTIPSGFKEASDLMARGHAAPDDHFLYQAVAGFVTAAASLRSLPDTDKRSIPNGVWILQEYFKTYIKDPYVIYVDAEGPFIERTSGAVIHEDAELIIEVFGTVDMVLRHEVNGNIIPGDHKTTSQLGFQFFSRLKPNHQYTGYLFLAQKVFGIMTNDFMVNALEVKARPKTARGKDVSFARQITTRDEFDMAEFKETVVWAVRCYLEWRSTKVWPLGHVNECTSYGGCKYLEVCSAPHQLRENLIEAKFQIPEKGGN